MLSTIGTAAQRGADLTRRLLAFSRRQNLVPLPVDVATIVESTMDMMTRSIGEHIEVEVVVEEGLLRTHVDQGQLGDAIVNLVLNARDALEPAQGGQIRVEADLLEIDEAMVLASGPDSEVAPGRYVAVRVSDNGPGIHVDDHARVFEPFYTTKEMGKGTGLGLSMVYGFLKQSGGAVVVRSAPGQGTTVELLFPALVDVALRTTESAPESAVRGVGERRVLLVEDEDAVRAIARAHLESLGHVVVEAADGDEALDRFVADPDIDVLVSDVILPGRWHGPQIAAELRRRRPELPVLFVTGYAHGEVGIEELPGTGPARILNKPYVRDDLVEALDSVLLPQR